MITELHYKISPKTNPLNHKYKDNPIISFNNLQDIINKLSSMQAAGLKITETYVKDILYDNGFRKEDLIEYFTTKN